MTHIGAGFITCTLGEGIVNFIIVQGITSHGLSYVLNEIDCAVYWSVQEAEGRMVVKTDTHTDSS